jgi:hypothetical protein
MSQKRGNVLLNGFSNIAPRIFNGFAVAETARQGWAVGSVAFIRLSLR